MALLESMTDDEFRAYVQESRPGLLAGAGSPAETDPKKTPESEEDDMALTPEALKEALQANPEVLAEALQDTDLLESYIDGRVASALAEERKTSDAERDAVVRRQFELRTLDTEAGRLIRESKLPDSWQDGLRARFQLREDQSPTAELDVVDALDEAGVVTTPAVERLREAVNEAIIAERAKLAEVAPTRVRGQGPTKLAEGETPPAGEPKGGDVPYWKQVLQEANVDTDRAFARA